MEANLHTFPATHCELLSRFKLSCKTSTYCSNKLYSKDSVRNRCQGHNDTKSKQKTYFTDRKTNQNPTL